MLTFTISNARSNGVLNGGQHGPEYPETAIVDKGNSLCVMCEQTPDAIKPWSLAKITFENGLYVHTSIRTYFSKEGAAKQFCLEQGLEWAGDDSIDDYC